MLLVTGGTGYLGSALVALLVDRGYRVRATVRDLARAVVLPPEVERIPADLDDEASLERAMQGCDGLFHLAASVSHSGSATRRANVEGTDRVLRAARRVGVRRVVYTSSSAAIVDASGLVSEDAPNRTALIDPYSTTKAEAEGLMLQAAASGAEAVIVNVVNAYGPSPRGALSYNALLLAAARGEVSEIVDAPVGWVLAEDVAIGHLLAFEGGLSGRRYVLCGEVASFSRVLATYLRLAGSAHQVRSLPPGSILAEGAPLYARRSEVYGKLGPVRIEDSGARALGFRPRGLDEGLRRTAEWLAGSD